MTKILIADDEPVMRKILQSTLEKNGYRVVTAEDGLGAWDILKNDPELHLAVLDWEMPGMNGVEICRKLQELPKTSLIYVILLTAKEGTDNLTTALEAGAKDYITKPFKKGELLARLKVGEELINLQSQLTLAQKMESIGQLASGIAHEINTPVQYVGDNIQFLQESFQDVNKIMLKCKQLVDVCRDNPAYTDLVLEIDDLFSEVDIDYLVDEIPNAARQSNEGVTHISKIVQAMKAFSHPGSEDKTRVDIAEAIKNIATVTRNKWKYVAELKMNFDPQLPLVPCLPGEFNQVIMNLIINAADAIREAAGAGSEDKGTISISTQFADDWVEIRVSDTGCGIPESIRNDIFNPFFTTKDIGKGTGQGLAISHAIVKNKHGGEITFETATGKGTTFIVRLPVNPASDEAEMGMIK